jgi:hypothetical protein
MGYPFSPNSSIDPGYGAGRDFSKDSLVFDPQRLSSGSTSTSTSNSGIMTEGEKKVLREGKMHNILVGSNSTCTTASLRSMSGSQASTMSPPRGDVSLYRNHKHDASMSGTTTITGTDDDHHRVLWKRSPAVPIPLDQNQSQSPSRVDPGSGSGGAVVGSLRSSLKKGLVSPLLGGEASETRARTLSDSEKIVRFDLNIV